MMGNHPIGLTRSQDVTEYRYFSFDESPNDERKWNYFLLLLL